MYPINLTIEIEDKNDVVDVFSSLRKKLNNSFGLIEKIISDEDTMYLIKDKRKKLREEKLNFDNNLYKLLEFSEKIENLINLIKTETENSKEVDNES